MADSTEYMETIDEEIDDAPVMTVDIDETLSKSGEAADAYIVGQRLATLNQLLSASVTTINEALDELNGEAVKTVQGIAPTNGNVSLDAFMATEENILQDIEKLFEEA